MDQIVCLWAVGYCCGIEWAETETVGGCELLKRLGSDRSGGGDDGDGKLPAMVQRIVVRRVQYRCSGSTGHRS